MKLAYRVTVLLVVVLWTVLSYLVGATHELQKCYEGERHSSQEVTGDPEGRNLDESPLIWHTSP